MENEVRIAIKLAIIKANNFGAAGIPDYEEEYWDWETDAALTWLREDHEGCEQGN